MPYQKRDDLPEAVKALPDHAQDIWMATFNSAWEQYQDEEKAFAVAWAAVKKRYKKEGDRWVAIPEGKHSDFPEWFEIFGAGRWTDSSGHTDDWTVDDLKEIAASYRPEEYEAPIVIGHPDTDSPAYGWIEALRVEGDKLLAKPKQLVDEFKEWVRRGLYKKISISLFPDLTLRHVGFLGGMPPAVKGLKPVAFKARKAGWTFEKEIDMHFKKGKQCSHLNPDDTFVGGFDGCVEHMMECEGLPEENAKRLCAYIGRRAGKMAEGQGETRKKGGNIMYEWLTKMKEAIGLAEKSLTSDATVSAQDGSASGGKFTEADLQAKVREAEERALAEAQKKIEAEKKEKEEAIKRLREIETKARRDQIHAFCEGLAKEGKIIPAWQKMGIEEFLFNLDTTQSLKFAEDQEKSPSQWFMDFLTELPKAVSFGEFTPKSGPGTSSEDERRRQLVSEYMVKNNVSYKEALIAVAKENKELFTI